MIYIIKGRQRKGKTTLAVGLALEYVLHRGYKTSEIYSNLRLFKPDGTQLKQYHYMNNREMRIFVRSMVEKAMTHVIVIIDEIDRVFPHRFWNINQQTEALLGLWQDEKLFHVIIGTAHVGKGIDRLIRESMQYVLIAKIDKRLKIINVGVIDKLDKRVYSDCLYHVDLIQSLFKSRLPIV